MIVSCGYILTVSGQILPRGVPSRVPGTGAEGVFSERVDHTLWLDLEIPSFEGTIFEV